MLRMVVWFFFYLTSIQIGYGAAPQGTASAELLLDTYLRLYYQNPDVFTVYQGKQVAGLNEKSEMLYRHICQDPGFKPMCKPYKQPITSYILSRLAMTIPENFVRKEDRFTTLYPIVKDLREKFNAMEAEFNSRATAKLFVQKEWNSAIQTKEDLNRAIREIYEDEKMKQLFSTYESSYLKQISAFPGLVLLSKKMKGVIEGNAFDVDRDDFLLSVEDLSKQIRAAFEQKVREKPESLRDLKLYHAQLQSEWVAMQWEAKGFHSLQIPDLTDAQFELIRKFHALDIKVVKLLLDNMYLKAFWRLRSLGHMDAAAGIETWITKTACADDQVKTIDNLGGGVTITRLVTYNSGLKGVYKFKEGPDAPYRGILEWLGKKASKYQHEIAVSRLDRLLNLNYVPITKKVNLAEGPGSLQLFAEPATQARFMNHAKNPKSSSRWAKHRGRAADDGNTRFLDDLISNPDRNIDNYLIQDDGQIVLIDHAFTFFYKSPISVSDAEFERMIPSRRVFYAAVLCDQNPEIVAQDLGRWLHARDVHLVQKRIHNSVKRIKKLIKKRGEDAVFNQMDEIDKQMGVYRPDLANFSQLTLSPKDLLDPNHPVPSLPAATEAIAP